MSFAAPRSEQSNPDSNTDFEVSALSAPSRPTVPVPECHNSQSFLLYHDVMSCILQFVNVFELGTMSRVSKSWESTIASMRLLPFPRIPTSLLAKPFPNLKAVARHIQQLRVDEDISLEPFSQLVSLRGFTFYAENPLLSLPASFSHSLRSLSIEVNGVELREACQALGALVNLTQLHLNAFTASHDPSRTNEQLLSLSNDPSIFTPLYALTKLQVLKFDIRATVRQYFRKLILQWLQNLPSLTSIDFFNGAMQILFTGAEEHAEEESLYRPLYTVQIIHLELAMYNLNMLTSLTRALPALRSAYFGYLPCLSFSHFHHFKHLTHFSFNCLSRTFLQQQAFGDLCHALKECPIRSLSLCRIPLFLESSFALFLKPFPTLRCLMIHQVTTPRLEGEAKVCHSMRILTQAECASTLEQLTIDIEDMYTCQPHRCSFERLTSLVAVRLVLGTGRVRGSSVTSFEPNQLEFLLPKSTKCRFPAVKTVTCIDDDELENETNEANH